jgi:hypothetical protein
VNPIYDSVRNEPRFQAILKKIGLEYHHSRQA